MSIKHSINCLINDYREKYWIYTRRKQEIVKFTDPRRKAIYNQIELSNEQKREIDDLYLSNYGHKIPYTWHRHYTAFTGKFDPAYFPELLFIPELEYYMNYDKSYSTVISDKNVLYLIANGVGVYMPRTYFSSVKGILTDNEYKHTDINAMRKQLKGNIYFAKPTVDSGSGHGCLLIDADSHTFYKDIENLGKDYVIQEQISCSDSIRALHESSVNTFRIMTYLWKDQIEVVPIVMRIGRGLSFLDNAHAGGIFIGIDNEGVLQKTAFSEFKEEYESHPDSNIQFEGYKIQNFKKVVMAAIRMHSSIPQLGVINWDFTIGKDENPILIEANTTGAGIWLFEMAWGCGPFGEKTEEILRWLRDQKRIPYSRR